MPSYSGTSEAISRKNEKRKKFTTAIEFEKVPEFKKQYLSLNKYVEFIGVSSSTYMGWRDSYQKDVLTSVSVAATEADRKRLRSIRKFN